MPNPENAYSPASPRPPRTWDFMETTFVSLLAYGVFTLTSGLAMGVLLAMRAAGRTLSQAQLHALATQGHWYGIALMVSSPLTVAVLWIAIRMARRDFAEYLALNWPSGGELFRALGIAAMLMVAEYVAAYFFGSHGSADEPYAYTSARQSGGLLIFLIGGCIAAPVMEEFVIRGFMFRGWSQSLPGPAGAIVLTSVVWALIHTQYDWYGRFWIFVTGLALGHFRWRSNSTWLTVIVHSAINIFIFFTMGLYL